MITTNSLHRTCVIGGEAGFGIMSAGILFGKLASRSGYGVCDYAEYPSIIRGGHNAVFVTIGDGMVHSTTTRIDTLIALHEEAITIHAAHLEPGAVIVFDADTTLTVPIPPGVITLGVPFRRLAKEVGQTILMRNTVALGAVTALWGGSLPLLLELLSEEFQDKAPEIIQKNHAAAKAGYEAVRKEDEYKEVLWLTPKKEVKHQLLLTGNDALSLGALAAGLEFAAIYPMTPTSAILHTLAPLASTYNFVVTQPEDEISAITMAIGASLAGRRSLVATSGGGFCLMAEGFGLAGMTETPIVVIEGMRGSPATGLPTWTEQGDLRFVLHAHQGEFPRIVIAPGDPAEAFTMIGEALFLADKYQVPVIVLVDKHLCEGHVAITPPIAEARFLDRGALVLKKQAGYKRYALTEDGISPRSVFGVGNTVVINSDEHTEDGYSSEEISVRVAQMEKRMKKMVAIANDEMKEPVVYGPEKADLTIVSWGSNKGAILEAIKELPNVNYIHVAWLSPFPSDALKALLRRASSLLLIEANYSAQLGGLIAEKTGIRISNEYLRYDGRPFFPEEIVRYVREHFFL